MPQHAISIHAPREGCDKQGGFSISTGENFNPRTPRGVRPHHIIDLYLCAFISIHAPREGCDAFLPRSGRPADHFNPRTPRGVRLQAFSALKEEREFQSTHPARGATGLLPYTRSWSRYFNPRTPRGVRPDARLSGVERWKISIHAPREGCDTDINGNPAGGQVFQSTHPARGATLHQSG